MQDSPKGYLIHLDDRELATVLVALRQFQGRNPDERTAGFEDFFEDLSPLSDEEIEDLCENINGTD